MSRTLDRARDYAEVHGGGGRPTMFEQDGILFFGNGQPAQALPEAVHEPEPVVPPLPDEGTLDDMDTAELKALVECYGGTWKNRDAAKRYIRAARGD